MKFSQRICHLCRSFSKHSQTLLRVLIWSVKRIEVEKFSLNISCNSINWKTFKGRPLIEYAEKLLKYPDNINFFFHAGETNWLGTSSDENLVKLILRFFAFLSASFCRLHISSDRRCFTGNEENRSWICCSEVSKHLEDCEEIEDWN